MTEDFPEINGLMWRSVTAADKPALKQLDTACKEHDGDEPVSDLPGDAIRAATGYGDNTLMVTAGDLVAALAWVFSQPLKEGIQPIIIGGKVHPSYRRRGIGEALISWAESRALNLAKPDTTLRLMITNEALTDDATSLYLDYGYENVLTEFMLVRSLKAPIPGVDLPEGLTERRWDASTASLFFKAYTEGFNDRLGDIVPVKEEWISEYTEKDEDFRADLSRVVLEGNKPIAFVTCSVAEKRGWIDQIAVVNERRQKGLARVLLMQAMQRFREEDCSEAALHVNANNSRAAAVFFDAGFVMRVTRARFIKEIMAAA